MLLLFVVTEIVDAPVDTDEASYKLYTLLLLLLLPYAEASEIDNSEITMLT